MDKIKVTNTSFDRDLNSKALLNSNKSDLDNYRSKKALHKEISSLRSDIEEMKKILSILIKSEK